MKKYLIYLQRTLIILFCIFEAFFGTAQIYAAKPKPEDQAAINNGTEFHKIYEDEALGGCPVNYNSVINTGNGDNQLAVWNFFRQNNLQPHQAAAIMGNMQEEAHFEPRLVEYGLPNSRGEISKAGKPSSLDDNIPPPVKPNGQPGYGIIQWTSPGRKNGLQKKVDTDPLRRKAGDITLQVEYMWQELNGPYKKSTLTPLMATTPDQLAEATRIVTYNYEIPANKEAAARRRANYAKAILAKYGSIQPTTAAPAATPAAATPTTTPATTDANNCASLANNVITGGTGTGAIAFMAIYLAWADGSHGLTPTAAYVGAINKYNPKAPYKGADCGAFVATVMRASGADPNYPLVGTSVQYKYVLDHPEKYDTTMDFTVADLQPGDILIVKGNPYGHTYVFVGEQVNGFNKSDASVGSRMPNLGKAVASDKRGHYLRARLK